MFFSQIMKCIQNSKLFGLLILIMGESGYLLIPKFAFTCRKILYYNISVSSAWIWEEKFGLHSPAQSTFLLSIF